MEAKQPGLGEGKLASSWLDGQRDTRLRLRAGLISLVAGGALLWVKFLAYQLTGSTAVLSDALESIVNVVAAVFALGSLMFAGRPADRNHPYGHGKIEYFAAAFEGGLIAFAAILIVYEAGRGFFRPSELRQLDLGLAITLGAGVANAVLGWFLIRTGKSTQSLTLVADGKHVLSDFWTSLGVVIGLLLVRLTGIVWFDPLVAAIVGLNLGRTGFWLVRHAAGGLLDEEDTKLIAKLLKTFDAYRMPGIIRIHHLRAIRSGRFTHVDAHVVVPEYWPVDRAHVLVESFEERVMSACGIEGEIVFHIDPCHRAYCAQCDVMDCPVRMAPFVARPPHTLDEAVRTDEEVIKATGLRRTRRAFIG
ncbi:MAG TPA: cation diffusion facilitator family transporter [Candidatus Tectomicrobia bacterium]|nr:cation diffusion facilitator family transporter [Candidatus Tectomicrobia bacterium]